MGLIIAIVFGLLGSILGLGALVMAILLYIEVKALQKSTHTVQYVPADKINDETLTKHFVKSGVINEPFDSQPDEVIL